jgi:hypothetical protein
VLTLHMQIDFEEAMLSLSTSGVQVEDAVGPAGVAPAVTFNFLMTIVPWKLRGLLNCTATWFASTHFDGVICVSEAVRSWPSSKDKLIT